MAAGAVIRLGRDGDIPTIVDLLNSVFPPEERITVEEFRHQETFHNPEEARQRLVVDVGERLVAVAEVANRQSRPLHKFSLTMAVAPEVRRHGIGTDLERRQRDFARTHGGTEMTAMIREDDERSRTFLEHRRYGEAYKRFEMELDVTQFAWDRFPDWRKRLEGLRLLTLADVGQSEDVLHRLYDISTALIADVPHPDGPMSFSYEEFQKYMAAPGFRQEALFLLADGEEWVGTSGIFVPEGRPGYTYFTGVRSDYRSRGLATALKLATIEYARDHGVRAMRTTNDTANNAMVAVNEKLGYRRLPGRVAMRLLW